MVQLTTAGTRYCVTKTTIYLPDDLKQAIAREAKIRATSEADVIRTALLAAASKFEHPKPTGGFIEGDWEPINWNTNDWLEGFGES